MIGCSKTNKIEEKGTYNLEGRDDIDQIKRCTTMEVEGAKPRGRQRKTWWDSTKEDMKRFWSVTGGCSLGGNAKGK